MRTKVTQEEIDNLISQSEIKCTTVYGKVTIVTCKLPSGFVITESSGAVDPENYSEEIRVDICLDRIKIKLWELEEYRLSCEMMKSGIEFRGIKIMS